MCCPYSPDQKVQPWQKFCLGEPSKPTHCRKTRDIEATARENQSCLGERTPLDGREAGKVQNYSLHTAAKNIHNSHEKVKVQRWRSKVEWQQFLSLVAFLDIGLTSLPAWGPMLEAPRSTSIPPPPPPPPLVLLVTLHQAHCPGAMDIKNVHAKGGWDGRRSPLGIYRWQLKHACYACAAGCHYSSRRPLTAPAC